MKHWTDDLRKLGACSDAIEWAKGYDSLDAAWTACDRGNWMLWLVGRVSGKPGNEARRKLALCLCDVVEPALRFVPDGVDASHIAIDVLGRWARGEDGVTLYDVRRAADSSAFAAARSSSAAAATAAAEAARVYAAAAAAERAGWAGWVAATDAASLKTSSNIVRRHYPTAPNIKEIT